MCLLFVAGMSAGDLKKNVRKLRKKLRQIEGLESRAEGDLTDAEKQKVETKSDVLDEIGAYETALSAAESS